MRRRYRRPGLMKEEGSASDLNELERPKKKAVQASNRDDS
jgi:hypothetical protein